MCSFWARACREAVVGRARPRPAPRSRQDIRAKKAAAKAAAGGGEAGAAAKKGKADKKRPRARACLSFTTLALETCEGLLGLVASRRRGKQKSVDEERAWSWRFRGLGWVRGAKLRGILPEGRTGESGTWAWAPSLKVA